jgi:hypothetical protein
MRLVLKYLEAAKIPEQSCDSHTDGVHSSANEAHDHELSQCLEALLVAPLQAVEGDGVGAQAFRVQLRHGGVVWCGVVWCGVVCGV